MRLFQLHEEQKTIESVDQLIEDIRRDCSDAVALYKRTNKVFIRGESIRARAIESNIRTVRKPIAMKLSAHHALTDAFNLAGLDVTRSNAIFCSTNNNIAGEWGEQYVIFPKNGWKGLVFKSVKNGYVFNELEDRILPAAKIRVPIGSAGRTVPGYDVEAIAKELKALDPYLFTAKTGDIVMKDGYEDVLIKGSGYYAVRNPAGTATRGLTDLPKILAALDLEPHNIGTHWEMDHGTHVTLDSWKEKVLKKYPDATFNSDGVSWAAKVGDKFVGVAMINRRGNDGKTMPTNLSQVFSHPRETDY